MKGLREQATVNKKIAITSKLENYRLSVPGPEISGARPVLVTFESFKDREEVLRKGNLSKNTNIHISEDLSKRTRESRAELRKFLRKVKKSNPDATCFMQHDKLYVNNKIYVFNDLQGKVSLEFIFTSVCVLPKIEV